MKDDTASRTARSVAAHRLGYERIPAPYGDPAADETLTRDVAGGMTPRLGRMHDYLRARTAFFDRVVVRSLDHGIRQVVVGGAGNAVTERVLSQFRQVTPPGSVLAISVSTSAGGCDARALRRPGRRARRAGPLGAAADYPERIAPPPPAPADSAPEASLQPAPPPAPGHLPLSALLSHALVAYTIECDNEFEHRMPHRSQNHGLSPGAPADAPWLPSLRGSRAASRAASRPIQTGGDGSRRRYPFCRIIRWFCTGAAIRRVPDRARPGVAVGICHRPALRAEFSRD